MKKGEKNHKVSLKFEHIWLDWLKINIYWIVCSSEEFIFRVKCEFNKPCEIPAGVDGGFNVYTKDDTPIGVIWVKRRFNETDFQLALVHECFHAVHWVCKERGICLDDSSDEVYAYLLMHLMKELSRKEIKDGNETMQRL